MVGCFENGTEPSVFTKYGDFIDQMGPVSFPRSTDIRGVGSVSDDYRR
jgi:hypothetical protein